MDNKNRRQGVSRSCRQREIGVGFISEEFIWCTLSILGLFQSRHSKQHTRVVSNHRPVALAISAVAQHAKIDAAIGGDGNARDDGRRQRRQQQQTECDEE
jgi:hypothetical protein